LRVLELDTPFGLTSRRLYPPQKKGGVLFRRKKLSLTLKSGYPPIKHQALKETFWPTFSQKKAFVPKIKFYRGKDSRHKFFLSQTPKILIENNPSFVFPLNTQKKGAKEKFVWKSPTSKVFPLIGREKKSSSKVFFKNNPTQTLREGIEPKLKGLSKERKKLNVKNKTRGFPVVKKAS